MHKDLWRETDGHCVYCDRRSGGQDATKDHLVPKSRGGPNHIKNYVPACKSCNHKRSKGAHHKNPLDQVHPRHATYVQSKIAALLEWLEKRVKNEVSPRKKTMIEKPCKTFLCSYHHDGCQWSINIMAYDVADAEARVKKLGNLKLDGELIATYPVGMGWLCKLSTAIRNFFWK